ncbi:MFS transporter [Craurococcus roseus]|uniref:MFS transporter n=1 Tax=Craurococcus roseus TaxID=77585 RepID=A0ABP3Q4A8_9PROT
MTGPRPPQPAAPPSDAALSLWLAAAQTISWGTLFTVFPLFVAPMEAELGWSRAEINGALTAGLLAAGLAAIPAGRWVDRRGGRGLITLASLAGAALLLAWSATDRLWLFYLVWVAIGVAQAGALAEPAYAVVVANARDARRAITGMTFITGFTGTIFLPLGGALIEALGWRGALVTLAALQVVPGLITAVLLRGTRPGLTGAAEGSSGPLRRALRRRAFWALALCFCVHAFLQTGIVFHLIPLLQERGLPPASVLLVVAMHGPCQVASRAALFALGKRAGPLPVGLAATALLPLAMLALGLAGDRLAALFGFALLWGVANGMMLIIRATGVAEFLGAEGYGQISGALATATVLPRTAAPLAVALIWEGAAGYAPVPWLFAALGVVGVAAFAVAASDRPGPTR